MKAICKPALAGLVSILLGIGITGNAIGQPKAGALKQQIVGTWTLASIYDEFPNGKRDNLWGPDVKGSVTYDSSGRFSQLIISAHRPKSESGPRAPVGQAIGYFGTYSVNEADKTVTQHIDRSTFPNFEGTDQKASIAIKGDQLSQVSAPVATLAGTIVPHYKWNRAR